MEDEKEVELNENQVIGLQANGDYICRFVPTVYRKTFTPFSVANSALGGIAYLADFSKKKKNSKQ